MNQKSTSKDSPIIPEGREAFWDLPSNVLKEDARWYGALPLGLEGVELKLVYFCLNSHVHSGTYPTHSHPFTEMVYTISGTGDLITNGERLHCKPGTVYLVHSGQEHSAEWACSDTKPWHILLFHFHFHFPDSFDAETDLSLARQFEPFYAHFFTSQEILLLLAPAYRKVMKRLTASIAGLLQAVPGVGPASIAGLWLQLLSAVDQTLREQGVSGSGSMLVLDTLSQHMLQAREILSNPAFADLNIEAIARKVGMSKFNFIRKFGAHFDIAPESYRRQCNLEQAGKLLTQTDWPIYQIADHARYSEVSAFSKSFKKYFHCSPKEYRKRYKNPE